VFSPNACFALRDTHALFMLKHLLLHWARLAVQRHGNPGGSGKP
jgi:hypothetical protein